MNIPKDKSPKVLVIGDLMIDYYLWGSSKRISPEAPVQIIDIEKENAVLGGAGNVVNNLHALGANVDVIGVIGNCENSSKLKELLQKINVDIKYLFTQKGRITSKKSRIIASQQQVVRFDCESSDEISTESQDIIINTFSDIILDYDVVLLSDYGKGVLTTNVTKSLIKIAKNHNKKILIDPKGMDYSKYKGAYLLTPNKKEASEATRIEIFNEKSLKEAIISLKNICNLDISIITLSESGVAVFEDNLKILPTITREVFDVTGAGDTILASLGFCLACDSTIYDAVNFANLAAGVVVGKIGSSTATLNEIIEYESSFNKSSSDKHIKSLNEISILCKELKLREKTIVFTNGCFDIIHLGHIKYLETAKSYGDILILGLNSDRSVEALKGEKRPINGQNDRAYILAALEVVDYVVIFDEDTPYDLIKLIKPDILVKGSDYEGQNVVGEDIAGELRLIEFVNDRSTTNVIKKIKQAH
jgi:D-beta-D-heptose 7-phosphate kinase / D-beta-D-heptose 1-phosphate adenosyltransferase